MSASKKGRGDDLKQEEILQAVVIADSFNVRFAPVTDKKPRALLPLVNVPMLDYTLKFLAEQGVQETLLFCSHLSSQIREHIKVGQWGSEDSGMTVKVILAEGSRSLGDALRDINTRSLIRNDFFLLNCDTISNVNLKELMQDHKLRREKFKSSVMTMTCMKKSVTDSIRCAEDTIFLALDPTTQQICDYQKVSPDKKIRVPLNDTRKRMTLHQDLMDGQLYVCSPVVLHLFTDNFDYCTLENFIRGVIINEEIYGNTVHVNVLKNQYCARVTNPYMYDVISHHIISRRTLPLTLKSFIMREEDELRQLDRNVYLGQGVNVSDLKLVHDTVIGRGTTVEANTSLYKSVIGPGCHIGANVKLHNCYLWKDVRIEDGCEVRNAILCDGVTVFANTVVQPHTVLSWNVRVGPDITLPPGIRLQDTPQVDEFDDGDEEEPVQEVTPEYGIKSRAFLYRADEDSDDEDGVCETDWGEALASVHKKAFHVDLDASMNSDDEESEEEVDEYGNFYSELTATLTRAKEEKIKLDNLILELNSLKHAYNISIKEVHQVVVKVLVEMPLNNNPNAQGKDLITAVIRHLENHKGLLKHYIKNDEAQWDCLHCLEDFAIEDERMLSLLSKVVQYLYNKDILEEHIILKWYHTDAVEDEEEEHAKIREQMESFVTWLEEAEEESDD